MSRPQAYESGRAAVLSFSTSQELKEWYFKKYPKGSNRSAIFTKILQDHKEQTEKQETSAA